MRDTNINEIEEHLWYQKQLENDDNGNWSCYTDVANADNPEFVQNFLNGNWSLALDERSDEPVMIPTNRAVGIKNVYYKPQSIIKISISGSAQFISGVKNIITTYAQPYINLRFQFVDSGGNIIIDNNYTDGGITRCLGCQTPNISISSASKGLVLHELGHALGMQHEMKNPNIKVTWIESVLIQMFKNADAVKLQITSPINPNNVNALAFDKNSIMIYNLPSNTNQEGIDMRPSSEYTDLDKQWFTMTYGPPPGFTGTITKTPSPRPFSPPQSTSKRITTSRITNSNTNTTQITKASTQLPKTGVTTTTPNQFIVHAEPIVVKSVSAPNNIITIQPSWLDNIILFVLSFFS